MPGAAKSLQCLYECGLSLKVTHACAYADGSLGTLLWVPHPSPLPTHHSSLITRHSSLPTHHSQYNGQLVYCDESADASSATPPPPSSPAPALVQQDKELFVLPDDQLIDKVLNSE